MHAGLFRISLIINIHEGQSISHFNESNIMLNENREIDPKINDIQTLFVVLILVPTFFLLYVVMLPLNVIFV